MSVDREIPNVTVVIPVFNRPEAVRRAIDSVLKQTRQDFEVLVIDDASTDGTPQVLASIRDPRVAVIRRGQNGGGAKARNTGIAAARAPYVAFLDSDDEWMPTKLERQLETFEREGERVALVYTGAERVFAEGYAEVGIPKRRPDLVRALLADNVVGETSVGMVRRSVLEEIGGFDESLAAAQDLDLWVRICERYGAEPVPEALVRVFKAADNGRISYTGGSAGREQFRRKHRQKMIRERVLHLHLRENAWWALRVMRDPRRARALCVEALQARPWALPTYGLLLLACLPGGWLDALAGWRHLVANKRRSMARNAGF